MNDAQLERIVMAHYWVWLAFTTEVVWRASRHLDTAAAIDLLDWQVKR